MLLAFISQLFPGKAQRSAFDHYPVYSGPGLGLTYSKQQSVFRIWSPDAEKAVILLYEKGDGENQSVKQQWFKKEKVPG